MKFSAWPTRRNNRNSFARLCPTLGVSLQIVLCLLAVVLLFKASPVKAQSISLTGPSNLEVPDADEFFTDIWGQGKNFNDICDVGFDGWHFEPETSSEGIWSGIHPEVNQPIIGIMPIPTPGSQLAYRENCGRLGVHHPLDADKYSLLSFRNATSNPSEYAVLWSYDNNFAIFGTQQVDGYPLESSIGYIFNAPEAFSIKSLDLKNSAPENHPWSGEIFGLSLFSTILQPAGGRISYDWLRIIDPLSSPTLDLSWISSGNTAGAVEGSVAIYVDRNSSGYDGEALEKNQSAQNGQVSLKTGVLPPGNYYFYAQLENSSPTESTVLAQSDYVGPITVNGKPTIKFNSPSRTSGREYSSAERADAWDMSSFSDLVNIFNPDGTLTDSIFRGFHEPEIINGTFQAKTDFDQNLGTVDTQVHFAVAPGQPVDPQKYRYFCYSMQVDPVELVRNGDPVELNRAGWVARLVWLNRSTGEIGSTKAHELIERSQIFPDYEKGFVDFCIDLWDEESWESGVRWTDMALVDLVRFDPLEAGDVTTFAIDWAGLFAENTTDLNRNYQIDFELEDPEANALSVEFFYDNNSSGFNGVSIGSIDGLRNGEGSFTWDASRISDGNYFIYAVVSDGINSTRFYSDVSVEVGGISNIPVPAATPCDFDGDGRSDIAVVRSNGNFQPANWFIRNSSTGVVDVRSFGVDNLDIFFAPDFNGDLVSDISLFRGKVDIFTSFISELSAENDQKVQAWGVLGDVPIKADLDGDGIDDPTVFRPQDGTLWSIRSTEGAAGFNWGLNGDIPVAADFDGDGRDDLAVWRPSDGFWWILQSSKKNSTAPADILYRQFGLPGDYPMVGDYTGDGIADLVVFRPSSGNWFVCPSETEFNCLTSLQVNQFGLPGDVPIQADFDGDGILDRAIYRPIGGYWFYQQSGDGQIFVVQHGGFEKDKPLCAGPGETIKNLEN